MPDATAVTLITNLGLGGQFRTSICNVGDKVFLTNGWDQAHYLHLKSGLTFELGIDPPGVPTVTPAAPSPADFKFTGHFRYRLRLWCPATRTLSLPGDEVTTTGSGSKFTITFPLSYPSWPLPLYWVIERTTADGTVFYPVNMYRGELGTQANFVGHAPNQLDQSSLSPDGTLVGTLTFKDVFPSDPAALFPLLMDETQARPPAAPLCWESGNRLWLAGALEYRPYAHGITLTATNGSATVTCSGGDGFPEAIDGNSYTGAVWWISFDDDGVIYPVLSRESATSLTLTKPYAGATGDKTGTVTIGAPGNLVLWSEGPDAFGNPQPENFGEATFNGVSNQSFVGNNARVLAAAALGQEGGLHREVLAKRDRLYVLTWSADPSFESGGRIQELAARRGALGSRCLLAVNGIMYGMDHQGMWAMSPGAEPVHLADSDFRNHLSDLTQGEEFWIQHAPQINAILFFTVASGSTSTNDCQVYSLDTKRFVGTRFYGANQTAGCTVRDVESFLRSASFGDQTPDNSGQGTDTNVRLRAHDIGISDGLTSETNLNPDEDTNVQPDSTSITFQQTLTINPLGCRLTRLKLSTGQIETVGITGQRDGTLFIEAWTLDTPATLDSIYWVGGILFQWLSGRITCGQPFRKKRFIRLWVRLRAKHWLAGGTRANSPLLLKYFIDGRAANNIAVPVSDRDANSGELWEQAANSPFAKLLPNDAMGEEMRLAFPLNYAVGQDIQLSIIGADSNIPFEIMAPFLLEYTLEDGQEPSI